jgi:hypothetical protein
MTAHSPLWSGLTLHFEPSLRAFPIHLTGPHSPARIALTFACNAVGEFIWYVRAAIVRKNENSRSKNLNKLTNFRSGA